MTSLIKISVVFADDIKEVPVTENEVRTAVEFVCSQEGINEAEISIVFVDDNRITDLNKRFLDHDRSTDVIAFSLENEDCPLEGEIYICTDMAKRQAEEYKVSFENELMRLAVHGTLHLLGYKDGTEDEKRDMLGLGEKYLDILAAGTGKA